MYLPSSRLSQRKVLTGLAKRFLLLPSPVPSPSPSLPPGFYHATQPSACRGSSSFSESKKINHSFDEEPLTNIKQCRKDVIFISRNGNNGYSPPSSSSSSPSFAGFSEQVSATENLSFQKFKKDVCFEDSSIKQYRKGVISCSKNGSNEYSLEPASSSSFNVAVMENQVSVSENLSAHRQNRDKLVRKRKREGNMKKVEKQENDLKKREDNLRRMEEREESLMRMKEQEDRKHDISLKKIEEEENNLVVPEDNIPKKDGITVASNSFWSRLRSSVKNVTSMNGDDWMKKVGYWKSEIGSTLKHYWVGTKLLCTDLRISSRLLLKLGRGNNLSRRERQQLKRTTSDMFRLVPFAVIVIVPFMELLLPVMLKLFPSMLPSTFQNKAKEEEAQQRILNARRQYAKFLQDTVKEMATEIKTTRSGDAKKTAEDLDKFMNKVRTGGAVTNEEILGFAKFFNDEVTLDNISRPRLISMCKYMGLKSFGTDSYLCYMLRSKLAWIKNDDKLIQSEGVDLLSTPELQAACRDRGILGILTEEEMRKQLKDWLDLSLNFSVPSSLLILSRAFTASGKTKREEAVQATLSSLPDEVIDVVSISSLPSRGIIEERERKLEFIKHQDELIKKAEENNDGSKVKSKKA